MKKFYAIFLALIFVCSLLAFTACDDLENPDIERAKMYSIGDVVVLGEKQYNIYAIQSGKILLLDQQKAGVETYNGINQCISEYTRELESLGVNVEYVGLLDYEDLDDLGGNKHSISISGEPYLCDDAPDFVQFEESYWLGGYSKYDTYTWLYEDGKIFHTQYNDYQYAVRPVVHIMATEIPE